MFYQNVFEDDFIGCLMLADRQLALNFKVKANKNTSKVQFAWNQEPFNLTGNRTLTLNYSYDSGKTWTALAVDVGATAVNPAAAMSFEIVAALNADATFAALYSAEVTQDKSLNNWLRINALRPREKWKTYISNTSAESIIRFNKKAGVAELPSYFARHTIANVSNYTDSVGMLIQLSNPVTGVDVAIVTDAGLNSSVVQTDWQLMAGRSGMFTFQKITVDGSDRITQIIEYGAGASAGDFARKTTYSYTGTNQNPDQIGEQPYVLTTGDLITP